MLHEHALAGAGAADEGGDSALLRREVHVAQDGAGAEGFDQVADLDRERGVLQLLVDARRGGCGLAEPAGREREEGADVGVVARPEFVGRACEGNATFGEERDLVGEAEDASHVVADDDLGDSELLAGLDQHVVDGFDEDGVEAGGRFVAEQDGGLACKGTRQAHPLPHAAGEFGGEEVAGIGEAELGEEFVDAGGDVGLVQQACFTEGKGDVVCDGHGVEERVTLKHGADATAEVGELLGRCGSSVAPHEPDSAFVGQIEGVEQFDEDRLARACAA